MKFTLVFLFVFAGTLRAQWPALGSSEDSLVAHIGKPDSSDDFGDYFHCRLFGIDGVLTINSDEYGIIQSHSWESDPKNQLKFPEAIDSLELILQANAQDKLSTYGEGSYRVWTNQDSVELLIGYDSTFLYSALSRDYYYPDVDSELISDSLFSISESALPLDSEETHIVKIWKQFLELPLWNTYKILLWSRYDKLMYNYFRIKGCPDFSFLGYKAKLTGIVYDPGFRAYVLSTIYSPIDTANPEFLWWKKTSRQITYLIQEDGNWKITSALSFITGGWKRQFFKPIEYHFPENHIFDSLKAQKAVKFVDSISQIFGVPAPRYIDYYFGFGGISTYQLLGLDVPDFNAGVYLHGKPVILLTDTVEDFFHELAHATLSPFISSGNTIITEGIATFLANDTADNRRFIIAADSLVRASGGSYNAAQKDSTGFLPYAIGLVLFQKLFTHGGMKEVVAFFKEATSDRGFEKALRRYFHVSLKSFNTFCVAEIQKAAAKLSKE